MKAVSSSSTHVAAVVIPSGPGGESSDLPADSEESMATKPSRLGLALREDPQVSKTTKERNALLTNHTSYRGVHKATQGDLSSVGQVVASFKVPSGSLSLVETVRKQILLWSRPHICNTAQERPKMPKASGSGTCCLSLYAVGMTVAFMIAVVVRIVTNGDCQEIHNGECL